jgi:hypothetical protein
MFLCSLCYIACDVCHFEFHFVLLICSNIKYAHSHTHTLDIYIFISYAVERELAELGDPVDQLPAHRRGKLLLSLLTDYAAMFSGKKNMIGCICFDQAMWKT